MLLWAQVVDRSGKRVLNLIGACLLGAAGLVLSTLFDGIVPELVGISLAVLAVSSARAIFWSIPTGFLTGPAAAGGLAFINSIGSLGGFAGPYLMGVFKESTGSFTYGLWVMAGILIVASLLTSSLWVFGKKGQ
jgi:ACS family tartrate transporter-like MFS transporter